MQTPQAARDRPLQERKECDMKNITQKIRLTEMIAGILLAIAGWAYIWLIYAAAELWKK